MGNIDFTQKSFIDLVLKVFVPVLITIIIIGIILLLYARRAKKMGTINYNHKINISASLISIFVTIVLLAITISFSVNFINTMKVKGLLESNTIIYYIMLGNPIVPFLFLIYLICVFIKELFHDKAELDIMDDDIQIADNYLEISDNKIANSLELNNQNSEDDIECL